MYGLLVDSGFNHGCDDAEISNPDDRYINQPEKGPSFHTGTTGRRWITSADLGYMTLVLIYSLLRLAWEKSILIIGLIKDSAAGELTKTVIPILQ